MTDFAPRGTVPAHFDFSFVDGLTRQVMDRYCLYVATPTVAAKPGAPRLLFVPGGYHGAWCYAHYMRYFSERGIACAAIDFQGHGSAEQDPDFANVTVAELGRQLIAAHDALPGPSVVVGHSMGALPAALCATKRDVAGLVLIAPSPPGNLPGAKPVTPLPAGAICPIPTSAQVRDRFLGVAEDIDIKPVMDRLTPEGANILNDRYLLRVAVDAARQRAPGMCIEAGRDNPERHPVGQDAAVAKFLNLDFVHLADAVHCMMYSEPWVASAQVIERWYNKTFN